MQDLLEKLKKEIRREIKESKNIKTYQVKWISEQGKLIKELIAFLVTVF